jgi:hypothetical protein
MRHIDNHSDAIHLSNHLLAKSRQPTVLLLITTAGQQALIVIGELHNHQPKPAHHFYQPNFIFNGRAVLGAKNNAHTPLCFGLCEISGLVHGANEVWIALKTLIPLSQSSERFAGIFVVRNGDMNRIKPALTHLLEDFSRPG